MCKPLWVLEQTRQRSCLAEHFQKKKEVQTQGIIGKTQRVFASKNSQSEFFLLCVFVMTKKGEKREIKIPEEVEIKVEENRILVKGEKGELEKKIKPRIKISKKDDAIILTSPTLRREDRALLGTAEGEIKNMLHGVREGITYKLKMVYSHFPVNLKVQGDQLWIENFLGEKYPRKAKILKGVKVNMGEQDVEVRGVDKEKVGQTAANIEQATKVKNRDRRVFQDGCYIYQKDGKSLIR